MNTWLKMRLCWVSTSASELKQFGHKNISLVRGKGLFNAIVIDHPKKDMAWDICMEMKKNGLLAKPTHGDRIRFAPPLLITRAQVDECLEIIKKSLDSFLGICAKPHNGIIQVCFLVGNGFEMKSFIPIFSHLSRSCSMV